MPPKPPKAAKGKQKPQAEEREESLQAVVSKVLLSLAESHPNREAARSLPIPLRRDFAHSRWSAQE